MQWLKRLALGLLAVLLLAVGMVYAWSGIVMGRRYDAEPRDIMPPSRPDAMERGKRLAQVYGCFFACHGEDMEGDVFFENWAVGRIIAPNLTSAVKTLSNREFEAIVRQGIRPDGRSVLAMPSASFAAMTDRDLAAVLAFIKDYPGQDTDPGRSRIGPLPRLLLILGRFKPPAAEVSTRPWESSALGDPEKLGEYMALMACSECHGMDFRGQEGFTPSLELAKGYSASDFRKLLSTGVGLGGRDLGVMSTVARYRFSKMTEQEVEALYRFLGSL